MVKRLNKREYREIEHIHHEVFWSYWNIYNIVRQHDFVEKEKSCYLRWLTDEELETLKNVVKELDPIEKRFDKMMRDDYRNDPEGYE